MSASENRWRRSRSPERNYHLTLVILFVIVAVAPLDVLSTDRCDADPLCIPQGQVGPVVPEGSNVTLTCHMDASNQRHASEIQWYSKDKDGGKTQYNTYTVVDNTTSQLHIVNVTTVGQHIYYCTLPDVKEWFNGGVIYFHIGRKPDPPNLSCFSHNVLEFWCQYEESRKTGVNSNFTMKFRKHFRSDSGEWKNCEHFNLPAYGKRTCFVNAEANPGYKMTIHVQQANLYGSAVQEIEFDPNIDVIPNPPTELHASEIRSRSLTMAWDLPVDWVVELEGNITYPESPLWYEIQYTQVDNPSSTQTAIVEAIESKTISPLLPYTSYQIGVRCKYYDDRALTWSDWTDNMTVTTAEEAPSAPVEDLKLLDSETSSRDTYMRTVTLQWMDVPVQSRNGEILGYYVYLQSNNGDTDMRKVGQDLSVKLDIGKFNVYTVNVAAFTSIGTGPNATMTIADLTRVPSPPEQGDFRADAKSNSSDVEVSWDEPTNPAGYVTQYELQWSQSRTFNLKWSDPILFAGTQLNYVLTNLEPFKEYYIRLRVTNVAGTSKWTMIGPIPSYGQVPGKPLLQEIRKVGTDLAQLDWQPPTQVHGELKTYMIRYKPNTKEGKHAWIESVETKQLDARVRVNCSIVSSRTEFLFEVMAMNSGGVGEPSRRSLHMCDAIEVVTIVVSVMSVCFCVTLLICCIMCIKQSDITKPAPEPYFIESILTPTEASRFQWNDNRSSPKHEKESFDTLRSADSYTELLSPVIQRMSSKDSSCTSTDQGIHDMDIDSLDLKNSLPDGSTALMANSSRRCNRYSSGMGQSIVSEPGTMTMRSNSNPGMEVVSEDYEDAVFEEVPQDMDEASMPCLSHTYARSASSSVSPPSSPNVDEIGSSSSLLSNASSGPPPYSQMASRHPQRLSSSGSDTSGVNYHTMSGQGLAPVTTNKKDAAGILAYSKLSQIPQADVAIDVNEDDDNPEYNQMGLRDPMLPKPNTTTSLDDQIDAPPEYHKLGLKQPIVKPINKSPSLSSRNRFNIPSVQIGSMVQPQNEIIVATALMPKQASRDETNPTTSLELDPCTEAKPCENGVASAEDDHSYSIVGANQEKNPVVKLPPQPPSSTRPNISNNSAYVPNGCCPNGVLPNRGFAIPNGTTPAKSAGGGGGIPIPPSTSINEGYVPNNSPPPPQSVFSPTQSPNKVHSVTNNNQGKMDGYAPATPQAMAAIVGGRPINNEAYVASTPVI